ncbi:MAG: tetratricopeptide repeat protein [Planctomycetaceae bacterium]|nr:tetratricopeptide repeat protein [Planctomycetaceae bacterium]
MSKAAKLGRLSLVTLVALCLWPVSDIFAAEQADAASHRATDASQRPQGSTVVRESGDIKATMAQAAQFEQQQKYEEAVDQYSRALKIDPRSIAAENNLAWLLATCPADRVRSGKRAIEHATRACELTHWKHPSPIDTLSVALAEDRQFDKAIALLVKLRAEAPAFDIERLDARIALFRAGKTYRQAELEKASRASIHNAAKIDATRPEVLALYQKAAALEQSNRSVEAAAEYEKAVARSTESAGADHADTGLILFRLADVYYRLSKWEQAASCYERALVILRRDRPRDDMNVTYAVNNLAGAYTGMGRFDDAARLHLENLRVREASLGEAHPHTLLSLHNLGMAYSNARRSKEAIPLLEKWLRTDPRAKPGKWELLPAVLQNLGGCHLRLRHLELAEHYLTEALKIVDSQPSGDAKTTVCILQHMVQLYSLQGAAGLDQAKQHGRRCIRFCRETFGPESSETARALGLVGIAYHNAGAFADAAPLLREAIRIQNELNRAGAGGVSPETAYLITADIQIGDLSEAERLAASAVDVVERKLCQREPRTGMDLAVPQLADIARRRGHWETFEERLKRLLESVEARTGKTDQSLAHALWLAAQAEMRFGSSEQARLYALRCLAVQRSSPQRDDVATADTLQCLGNIAGSQAKYADAESYQLECLAIRRKNHDNDSVPVASCLCDLGFTYFRMQRYAEAEAALQRAVRTAEKAGYEGESSAAGALNYLGRLYCEIGETAKAENTLKRTLALARQHEGEHSDFYSWSLTSLAQYYASVGRFGDAETIQCQAVDAFRKLHGGSNSGLAVVLSGLSEVLFAQGKYDEADKVVRESLKEFDRAGKTNDRNRHITLKLLVAACVKRGQWEEAVVHCTEERQASRRWMSQVLPAMAPAEQLVYLFRNEKLPLFEALSIALHVADKPRVAEASAEWLLNSKGTGAECLAEQMHLARGSDDSGVKSLLAELASVRAKLAKSVLQPRDGFGDTRGAEVAALCEREQDLARQLGSRTRTAIRSGAWLALADVRKTIRSGSVLVEIARFPVIDFGDLGKRPQVRYVAWVIPSANSGKVQVVDLGDAAVIDAAIADSRRETLAYPLAVAQLGPKGAFETMQRLNARLARLVYEPLKAAIGTASTVLISPDGGLWLFPWEALVLDNGNFLVEEKQIRYLVTSRALVNADAPARGKGAVLFTEPDYDLEPPKTQPIALSEWNAFSRQRLGATAETGLLAGARFSRLPDESEWADASVASLRNYAKTTPIVSRGKEALEATFKAMKGPQVLIVSTHGYFLSDQLFDNLPLTENGRRAWAAISAARVFGAAREQVPFVPEPLLRCGLALAGANRHYRYPDANDGVLTGLEILGTDLRGTELVVLNACDTGVGALRDGEGTAGLHQAFRLAGAQVVVASLWRIPAAPYNRLLKAFFANLASGQTKAASLRNAELEMIAYFRKTMGVAHPALWAAFTMTGGCRQ